MHQHPDSRIEPVTKLDRLQILARLSGQVKPPTIPGYRVVRDTFVRSQTKIKIYARVAESVDDLTGTRIFIQYEPQLPRLTPFKVTVIPDDNHILSQKEIRNIVRQFSSYRFLLLEIALDFQPQSGLGTEFVRRFAVFGKCRPNKSRLFVRTVLYGSRQGDKLVRGYWKEQTRSFRIELELHSSFLRRYRIARLEQFRKLPSLLCPNHIRFVQINWATLKDCLSRRGLNPKEVAKALERAREECVSLHEAMEFLRVEVGVHNIHRFLMPVALGQVVHRSLRRWAWNF